MAQKFYIEENIILEMPKGRDTLRVMQGVKEDGKKYLDIRTWYRDDADELKPGKGFAAPLTPESLSAIAGAIQQLDEYAEQFKKTGDYTYFNPKTREMETRNVKDAE